MNAMTTTQTLSALLGLYFIAGGIFLVTDSKAMPGMMKGFSAQPVLGFVAGIIAFVIGGLILAVHNDWSSFLAGFITLIGWIALLEGFLMIALPKWFLGFMEGMDFSSALVRGLGAGVLVLGAVMLWAGVMA